MSAEPVERSVEELLARHFELGFAASEMLEAAYDIAKAHDLTTSELVYVLSHCVQMADPKGKA